MITIIILFSHLHILLFCPLKIKGQHAYKCVSMVICSNIRKLIFSYYGTKIWQITLKYTDHELRI